MFLFLFEGGLNLQTVLPSSAAPPPTNPVQSINALQHPIPKRLLVGRFYIIFGEIKSKTCFVYYFHLHGYLFILSFSIRHLFRSGFHILETLFFPKIICRDITFETKKNIAIPFSFSLKSDVVCYGKR